MFYQEEIKAALAAMGAPQDGVVLMHCSWRSVGEVEGGCQGFLDALVDYFTAKGGLFCVPTHTWDNLGTDRITLDLCKAESNLGYLTVLAAGDPRAVRSENPTHSMAVYGDPARAAAFVAGEELVDTPIHPDSCYGKLYRMGGKILLCGVGQERNTYLHTAEELAGIPNRMLSEITPVTVRKKSGEVVHKGLRLFNEEGVGDVSLRFPKYETAFRYHRAITDGFLGNAPTQLCDARIQKQVVELIYTRGGDQMRSEAQIPPAYYCS